MRLGEAVTRDGANRYADFLAEIMGCPTDVQADLACKGGWEILADGTVIAHVDARGAAHALVGPHTLLEIAVGRKRVA